MMRGSLGRPGWAWVVIPQRPIGIVIHNTASPTLKRWHEVSRERWMVNLESYYKGLGWSGGPHLFIDDGEDGIGLFNH